MTIEIRNAQHVSGGVDCEVNHPALGWIDFTATESDLDAFGQEVWMALKDRSDIAPYVPPPPVVPDEITKLQLVRALRDLGLWSAIKSALESADTDTKEDWDFATTIPRNDPLITPFTGSLGISEEETDAVFIAAAEL